MNKYNKIVFVNGSAPPLNADNLNHMDEGIERATDGAIALETEIATAVKIRLEQGLIKQTRVLPESLIQCRSTANPKITARVISQAEQFTTLCL